MKKLVVLTLSSIMMMASAVTGYAGELEPTVMSEVWNQVADNMNSNTYGGMYLEDNILHVKPVKIEEVQAVIQMAETKTRSTDSNIVLDDIADYTYQELLDAQKKSVF